MASKRSSDTGSSAILINATNCKRYCIEINKEVSYTVIYVFWTPMNVIHFFDNLFYYKSLSLDAPNHVRL